MSRSLKVRTNPFHAWGPLGQPSGVVTADPSLDPSTRSFVGVTLASAELVREGSTEPGALNRPRYSYRYDFVDGDIEIPDTAYYRRRIMSGELLAADAATAKRVGIEFVDPEQLRYAAELAAKAAVDEALGEGAFEAENGPTVAPSASATPSKVTPIKAATADTKEAN